MPIAGENIGTAYVRVIADGKDLDDSIRDMFADADADFNEMGQRGSKAYADGWEKNMSSAPSRDKLRGAIGQALATGDFAKEFLASPKWGEFRTAMVTRFGDAGRLAGERMEQELFRTGVAGLDLEGLNVRIAAAQGELFREMERMEAEHTEALRLNRIHDANVLLRQQKDRDLEFERNHAKHLEHLARLDEIAVKESLDRDREFFREHDRLAALAADKEAEYVKAGIDLDREFTSAHQERQREAMKLHDTYALLNREAAQLLSGDYRNAQSKSDLRGYINSIRTEMRRLNIENDVWVESLKDIERNLILLNPTIDRYNRNVGKIADTFGIAFGRGSRNNFLNFMGSFARNMARFPLLLSAPIGALMTFRGEAALAFRTVRDGGGSMFNALTAGISQFVRSFGGIGVKIAGAVVGAFGFAGPLLSMLSMLGGAVSALVSSLSFGLVGVLGSLPAVLLPGIAAVGTLALAFGDLSDAQKKALEVDMKPLIESFKDLADAASIGVFSNVEQQASRLAGVLDGLRPMFRRLGFAVSDVGDSWIESMTGEGFERWRDLMTIFLPDAVRSLGRIVGNTIGGFGGLFTGMIPFMREVLSYFERLTEGFSDWANSTTGQSEINSFFDRTIESLIDIGDFLGSVRDLFNELVSAGQSAGDGLFASMSDAIDGWVATIQANPDILSGWYDSAESFAKVIGNLIVEVGKLFATLDTEASRMLITSVFATLGEALELVTTLLGPVARLLDGANKATDGLVVTLGALLLVGPKVLGMLGTFAAGVSGFARDMGTAETRAARFQNAMRGISGMAGLGLLAAGLTTTNDALSGLMTTVGAAATGFSVAGPWGAAIGGLTGLLVSLVKASDNGTDAARDYARALQDVKPVDEAISSLEDLAATLDQVTGAYTATTRAAVLNKLEEAGLIETAAEYGVSARQMVNAALGVKGSLEDVRPAVQNYRTQLQELRAEMERIATDPANFTDTGLSKQATDDYNALKARENALKENLAVLKQMPGAVRDFGKETREAYLASQDFGDSLKGLPPKVSSKIEATGVAGTTKAVAELMKTYKLSPKRVSSIIEAIGAETSIEKVEKYLARLREADRQRPKPVLGLDNKPFDSSLSAADRRLKMLIGPTWTAKLDVDNSGAAAGISETERWLASIQDEIVYVNVERRSGGVQEFAGGGIVYGDQRIRAGEAGPEAVVPLNRDLSMVDPAVRWLSAIAQGLMPISGGGGKTINVGGLTVVTPSEDPVAVAKETVNTMVASAYGA